MRITVIFLMIVWGMSPLAKAQDSLQAGVQLAFNQSSVIDQNMFEEEALEHLGGVEIGMMTLFKLNESFDFRPGLSYAQKGFRIQYNDEQFQTRLHYLKVPVTARLNFQVNKATMFANVGPYLGWLLSATESGVQPNPSKLEDAQEFVDADANVTRNYKYGDVGLRGGVGVMYPFWEGNITLQVNYEEGFVDIINDNSEETSLQNKGYQIAVGYLTTIR